jgi:putative DNA primase/helicase
MNTQSFEAEIAKVLNVDVHVTSDGQIQRFSTNGKRGDTAGWCVFFDTAGAFGDWRSGLTYTWSAGTGMTDTERTALRRKVAQARQVATEERARKHRETQAEAARVWGNCLTSGVTA